MSWGVVYYKKADGTVPAASFLAGCPAGVRATILAVLEAVRAAPPPQFSGGGMWESMHGDMGGYYEIRVTGPRRTHYRLFWRLDNGTAQELAARGFDRPQIAVITACVNGTALNFPTGTIGNSFAISATITSPPTLGA